MLTESERTIKTVEYVLQMSMNVRWAPTAVERAKSVTTCPAATAVTAKPATSTTPFASSVLVCINRHIDTHNKYTAKPHIASSHKTSLQKWPYKILSLQYRRRFFNISICDTGKLTSDLKHVQVSAIFWSILNHSCKIKYLKGFKKVWIPWLNYPKDVIFSVVSQTNSMHIDEADSSSCSIERADYPNLLSLLLL